MKEFLAGNKALKSVILELAETAGYLWQRGWAERNAGNISVNINDLITQEIPELNSIPFFELSKTYPKLAGACFLVTGTGKRMRDLAQKP
jgi:rhamnulose-1-phosphate aldolase